MATLDEKGAAAPEPDDGAPPASALVERRRRALELLSTQREKLDRLENALPDELQRLAELIGHDLAESQVEQLAKVHAGEVSGESAELQLQLDHLRHQLAARQGELDHLVAELEHARLEAARFEQELRVCQSLLEGANSQGEQRRLEFAALHEQLSDAQAQLTAAHERQDQLRHELAEQRERNVVQQEETAAERRRLARELKAQRARRQSEEQQQANLQSVTATGEAQLATQLTAARVEVAQARSRLSELGRTLEQRSEELSQERRKGDALKDQASQLRDALKKAQAERSGDKVENARAADLDNLSQDELKKLRHQCDSLTAKLGDAERSLAESEAKRKLAEAKRGETAKSEGDTRKKEDLQRRFEMAVDELREMKRANAELEAKLAKRSESSKSAHGGGMGLDWEAQKQRLLASLEADDRDDEEAVAERHTIEGTIRITDQIIAQKDQEIAELKRQLADRAEGAALTAGELEIAEVLDHDEVIRQERERLTQVQAEWREKIGNAEIAISVERAKIARQRAELEEKLRVFQREQQLRSHDEPLAEAGKPPRSRWLARLGLKELDDTSDGGKGT